MSGADSKQELIGELPPDKLAAFVRRLEQERDARNAAKLQSGEGVKVFVSLHDTGKGFGDYEAAKQRALKQAQLPEDKTPIYQVVKIDFTGKHLPPEPQHEPLAYTPPARAGDPVIPMPADEPTASTPQRVIIDGADHASVIEGWFKVENGVLMLCDLHGNAHAERHRLGSHDDEGAVARVLLHKRTKQRPADAFHRTLYHKPTGIM